LARICWMRTTRCCRSSARGAGSRARISPRRSTIFRMRSKSGFAGRTAAS